MLYFFISCVPFILLSHSLSQLLSIWFCGEFPTLLVSWLGRKRPIITSFLRSPVTTMATKQNVVEKEERAVSLLDLPDLALDCIFECLPPAGLRSMAGVCSSLREQCTSDHLWEMHLRRKWGGVVGGGAYREWQCELASTKNEPNLKRRKGLFESLVNSWIVPRQRVSKAGAQLPADSLMAWYLSLESGEFWFPAQVYNRENGHIGFMLSCYDARLCYDSKTDTFEARYSPYGRRTTEENIEWDRLRAPPVDTQDPFALHVSDCLQDLKPGDHVEIQWRRNKDFPYGWWYGVVAHSEMCDGNENHCRCHCNDNIVLEFKQYNPGSKWRQTMVNRKDHREEGNEVDGFYGGIRKLYNNDEIARWNRFWPTQDLEQ